LLKACPVEYRYMEPFHNWQQLCAAADAYRLEHTRRQIEASAHGPTQATTTGTLTSYPYVAIAEVCTCVHTRPARTMRVPPASPNTTGIQRWSGLSALRAQLTWARLQKRVQDWLPTLFSRLRLLIPMVVGMALAVFVSRWLPPASKKAR
jgi:hypothetical protein